MTTLAPPRQQQHNNNNSSSSNDNNEQISAPNSSTSRTGAHSHFPQEVRHHQDLPTYFGVPGCGCLSNRWVIATFIELTWIQARPLTLQLL